DADGALLCPTIGNDVTARDVEGANPLYLPQAKLFAAACALGPAILIPEDWSQPFEIELRLLSSDGATVYEAKTSTASMRRSFEELASWVVRENPVPAGSVLLTGTGVVPPDEVALAPGQHVEIRIRGIGKPLREARMESARTAAIFRYFAGEASRPKGELYEQAATGSSLYTLRRPLGVVGLITPWNFPAAIPAWKMAPALVYGNTVVLKLAQEAPL